MARRVIEHKKPESLLQIEKSIEEGESFILEAGAGSGKTWTLVEALKFLIHKNTKEYLRWNKRISCITYTNVAKNEIKERVFHNELVEVNTIHEFLWSVISHYPKELKEALIELNNARPADRQVEELEELLKKVTEIEYLSFRKWEEGIISHDEVIKLSIILFSNYPRLAKIVRDSYPVIFIDEYQDTQKETIEILLGILVRGKETGDEFVVGFFGDSMQKNLPNWSRGACP